MIPMGSRRFVTPRGVAELHELLAGDDFRAFLAELTEALESGSDPGTF